MAVDADSFVVTYHSNANPYIRFAVGPATSPFGNVTLSSGKFGYNNNNRFNSCTSGCCRSIVGGVKLEAADKMTSFPTSAPTAPLLLGSITTARQATPLGDKVFGVQFNVVNTGLKKIIITRFQVPLDTGTRPIEVWFRNGSYKVSVAGIPQWHNYGGQWMKVVSASVTFAVTGGIIRTKISAPEQKSAPRSKKVLPGAK